MGGRRISVSLYGRGGGRLHCNTLSGTLLQNDVEDIKSSGAGAREAVGDETDGSSQIQNNQEGGRGGVLKMKIGSRPSRGVS